MASTTADPILESDLFKADKKTIDTLKVIGKIWESRKDSTTISKLAELLCKFVDEKRVFEEIEFFFPQLAHLIIHLDQNSRNEALELLAMVIAQTSVHAALQFSFAFTAALEDYQPEMNGAHNPHCNPFFFRRCARLLTDVERAVIYGGQEMSNREIDALKHRMVRSEKIDKSTIPTAESDKAHTHTLTHTQENHHDGASSDEDEDEQDKDHAKKTIIAQSLARAETPNFDGKLNGELFFKRNTRKSSIHSKAWKQRFFVVDHRVLLCFREPHNVHPLRAISLQNCAVTAREKHAKYGDTCFDVTDTSTNVKYQLRAATKELRDKWVEFIHREINGAPQLTFHEEETDVPTESAPAAADGFNLARSATQTVSMAEMTPVQRKRFAFFRQLRIFLTNLTNICDSLRFKDRTLRKHYLMRDMRALKIPPYVYLPLLSSSDNFHCILRALPAEAHAFSTKARVPALMLFELQRHPCADVASFLGRELESYPEADILSPGLEVVVNYPEEDEDADNIPPEEEHVVNKFLTLSECPNVWAAEGKGIERMEQAGIRASLTNRPFAGETEEKKSTSCCGTGESAASSATVGVLGETFAGKIERIRESSPYSQLPGWSIGGLIAKSNDDVRQEVFVMQLISYFQKAFKDANVPVWLRSYKILSTSKSTGLIELIPNAISIDGLKKQEGFPGDLRQWYEKSFGYDASSASQSATYMQAMENYVSSLAGYSIISYLLAIKDRHNGNIMIDKEGHMIHIDFGFVFGFAPGKAFSMEKAPWKLNKELVGVMQGRKSALFKDYRDRCVEALKVARRHAREVTLLLEIMQFHSNYPAFRYNPNTIRDFRSRLFLEKPDQDVPKIVDQLLSQSYSHTGTNLYDSFQLATNGIAK